MPGSLDYKQYSESRWLYDTPGLVNEQQVSNLVFDAIEVLVRGTETGAIQ